MLHNIDMCSCNRQLESQQRLLGKTVVVKVGAYIVSIDRKTTAYRIEFYEIVLFLKNMYQADYSNVFPYFTDLPVSSSL